MIKSEGESVISQSQPFDIIIKWNESQDLFIQMCGFGFVLRLLLVLVYLSICLCVSVKVIKSEGESVIQSQSFDIIIHCNRSQDLFIQIWFYSSRCPQHYTHCTHTRNNPDLNWGSQFKMDSISSCDFWKPFFVHNMQAHSLTVRWGTLLRKRPTLKYWIKCFSG